MPKKSLRLARECDVTVLHNITDQEGEKTTMPKKSLRLARECDVTVLHNITDQEIDEGVLNKGTLIRKAHVTSDNYGTAEQPGYLTTTYFECSTDQGKTWYKCKSLDPVCTCVGGCELSCDGCPHCESVARGESE